MSRKCQVSKKKGLRGNRVSHSNRKTKHTQEVNLQTKRFIDPETGKTVKLRVSGAQAPATGKLLSSEGPLHVQAAFVVVRSTFQFQGKIM